MISRLSIIQGAYKNFVSKDLKIWQLCTHGKVFKIVGIALLLSEKYYKRIAMYIYIFEYIYDILSNN